MKNARNLDILLGLDVYPVFLPSIGIMPIAHPFTGMLMNPMDFLNHRKSRQYDKTVIGTQHISSCCFALSASRPKALNNTNIKNFLPVSLVIPLPLDVNHKTNDYPSLSLENEQGITTGLAGLRKLTKFYAPNGI